MTYHMPSLTKKILRGKPYYYLRECQRVNGKPKIISTIYLGTPQSIFDRLLRPEPSHLALREFGASAALFSIAQALQVVTTIDRHVAGSARGISPRAAHRSGREPLDSSGSCHPEEPAGFRQDLGVPPVAR